jgi:hypothetical protein
MNIYLLVARTMVFGSCAVSIRYDVVGCLLHGAWLLLGALQSHSE